MRHFYLAIAFVFLSGPNTLAQQSQLDEFSTLAVQITSTDRAPFTLPVYKDRTFETTWSGEIPHPAANIRQNIKREAVHWYAIFEFRDGRWYCTIFNQCCD